jgi:hypothetical protein
MRIINAGFGGQAQLITAAKRNWLVCGSKENLFYI